MFFNFCGFNKSIFGFKRTIQISIFNYFFCTDNINSGKTDNSSAVAELTSILDIFATASKLSSLFSTISLSSFKILLEDLTSAIDFFEIFLSDFSITAEPPILNHYLYSFEFLFCQKL